jgi:hypothetical protein
MHVEAHRRARRLAPGVVGLCLVMILATFVFLIVPSPVAADPLKVCQQCPNNPSLCQPNCGSLPPCPGNYMLYIGSGMLTITSTNASIQFWLLSTSGETSALSSLTWGPNTNYAFTALNNQGVGTTGSVTAFIDYLDPSATYYYHVHAWTSCTDSSGPHQYTGDYYGSWTQAADPSPAPFNYYIQGTVRDTNGVSAPANIFVQATCEDGGGGFGNGTKTNSAGYYSMNLLMGNWCANHGGYVVQVRNQVLNVNGGYSSQWGGRWNETIVIWAPQVVNFYLPLDYVSGFVPLTYDFTNSSYVLFTVSGSSTFTTQEGYALSIQGAISGVSVGGGTSYSASASATTQSTVPGVTGDSFVMQQEYSVTGTMVFNAVDGRQVSLFPNFYQPSGTIGSGPTTVSDWLPRPACNSDPGVVYCVDFEGSQPFSNSMSAGGSYTLGSSFNWGISESVDIPGLGPVSASVTESYTTSFTSSTSYTISFSVASPSNVCYGFEYVYQGDNSGAYGVVAHVWNLGNQPQSDC